VFTKLRAINTPDTENVHCLCLDRAASHGMNESTDATDAPKPNNTRSDGSAQQSKVLNDVNSEK